VGVEQFPFVGKLGWIRDKSNASKLNSSSLGRKSPGALRATRLPKRFSRAY